MERFEGIKALVIGDVMIDTYTTGVVERMSPEAPVPILNVQERFDRLGGAANVALNMKALGAEPILCSIIGDDSAGKMLIQMMQDHDMNVSGLVSSHRRKTTLKHRILNDGRQMMRIDEEDTFDLSEMEYAILSHVVKQLMDQENIQVVVLQDYNKGVLTEQMIHRIVEMAHEKSIPVVVDPKKKNFFAYRGVTLFKPNGKELRDGLGVHAETIDELRQAAQQLQERLQCQHLMVTLSEQGAMILSRDDGERGPAFVHVPACPRNIVDVSGAGDTVLSVAALCTAKGQDPETIVSLSNIAGGLVCEEVGVVPIDRKRFEEEVQRLRHD